MSHIEHCIELHSLIGWAVVIQYFERSLILCELYIHNTINNLCNVLMAHTMVKVFLMSDTLFECKSRQCK